MQQNNPLKVLHKIRHGDTALLSNLTRRHSQEFGHPCIVTTLAEGRGDVDEEKNSEKRGICTIDIGTNRGKGKEEK